MRRCTDPLALDPFSPIADSSSTTDQPALEPLSPLHANCPRSPERRSSGAAAGGVLVTSAPPAVMRAAM